MIEPADRTVPVAPGVALHVRAWEPVTPSAPSVPFALLHGIASNARIWDGVAERLAARGHRAFAIDLRGHGLSDAPDGGYDVETFAADVVAVIAGLSLGAPVVVGQSLGADVALEAVARAGALFRGAVLVEGGVTPARDGFESLEQLRSAVVLPPVAGIPAPRVEAFLRGSNPTWPEWRVAAAMAGFRPLADGTLEWRIAPGHFDALIRSMWERSPEELWPAVRVPTLVVLADTGDERSTAAKRRGADAIERAIERTRAAWFTSEHDVHAALPDETAALLLSALGDGFITV